MMLMLALSLVPALVFVLFVVWTNRSYPRAKLVWLFKRLVGFCLVRLLPIPIPRTVSGAGSTGETGKVMQDLKAKRPLVVTDSMIVKLGLAKRCLDSLEAAGLQHVLFDSVKPDPPSELMEEGFEAYKKGGCDSIIAFGGGSPMDVAKLIGAKVVNPNSDVSVLAGFFNVTGFQFWPLPPLVAIPTTAGTGSETTIAAVTSIVAESKKCTVADQGLVPRVAVLDPEILAKLPKAITAATGLDALTHAIESYIGGWTSSYTAEKSLSATGKIFENLCTTYHNGTNLEAREKMLLASYEAGLAFTRANVGYVHAIAHQLGALFHTPHGEANAMLLPHVLDFYLERDAAIGTSHCIDRYCELAKAAGLVPDYNKGDLAGKRTIALEFVKRIRTMCTEMSISTSVEKMKVSDVSSVAIRALNEGHGELHSITSLKSFLFDLGYPVPHYMTMTECENIVAKVLPSEEAKLWTPKK